MVKAIGQITVANLVSRLFLSEQYEFITVRFIFHIFNVKLVTFYQYKFKSRR